MPPKSASQNSFTRSFTSSFTRWTKEDHYKMIKQFNEGMSFKEIASFHSRTIGAIKKRIFDFLVYPTYMNKAKYNIEELAETYKMDEDYIREQLSYKTNVDE